MGKRDQVRRALGTLNGRDTGNTEDIAFLGGARADQLIRCRLHGDATGGSGDAVGFWLGTDVHHMCLAVFIEMVQFGHKQIMPSSIGTILYRFPADCASGMPTLFGRN